MLLKYKLYVILVMISFSTIFKLFESYLNRKASCLAWMNDFQHQSGRHNFYLNVKWSSLWSTSSLSSISTTLRCFNSSNYCNLLTFSSFVTVYLIYKTTSLIYNIAKRVFKDSSWIKLSLMSSIFILWFWVMAEQICDKPLGPIRFFERIRCSIVFVSLTRLQISIAPLLPSLLSVRSSTLRS